MRNKLSNFTDGVLHYGKIETKRNENKVKTGVSFVEAGLLFFNFREIRQEDQDFYSIGKDASSNLKVQTFNVDGINKETQKVVINDDYYEITGIDPSNDRKTLYWYLTKKGALNEIQ